MHDGDRTGLRLYKSKLTSWRRIGATEAEVRAAATTARVDEVIERLPDGWATAVREGGTLPSGSGEDHHWARDGHDRR
ncbi:hypothetical protein [Nonomuraea sp. NPDC049709]|uniref:hypothetical protein n=1 Tax=Nonomuraea sp. NPDC049709 TaxID=3154736 RepID=UPI00341753ED